MKKYELTNETIEWNGVKLHRIRALRDFLDVKRGDLGGFVETELNLGQSGDCWVGDSAIVCASSVVGCQARVCDNARVFGWAQVSGNALVGGHAKVFDCADVLGDATIRGEASVCHSARIYGEALVLDDVLVCGRARVFGNAVLRCNTVVGGSTVINGGSFFGDHAYCFRRLSEDEK